MSRVSFEEVLAQIARGEPVTLTLSGEPVPTEVICGWCRATLVYGSLPPSHGICERCAMERSGVTP